MMEFIFSYGPLLVAVLYLLPIIIGVLLMKQRSEISLKERLLWCLILIVTNYLGLIGLLIYLKKKSYSK